ncbi:MAG TPA: hypothetical protein VLA74_00385 [Nitrososphaeraceae archaeon]|nr:hypothetical protein [Nitrososphaeraceae archaeon]
MLEILFINPRSFFLDEPTLGLDPNSRKSMWIYIQKLVKEEKITIILTTHYMEEADKLCNRIGFINKGKIIAIDTPEQLKRRIKNDNTGKYIGDTIKLYFKAKEEEEDNSNENNFNNSNETIVKN